MGFLNRISRLGGRLLRIDNRHSAISPLRICRLEHIEPRNLMTASTPQIIVGGTEFEQASGTDGLPNVFVVTFQGGAPGTQLTHLEINGKKSNTPGLSFNDAIFDTAPGGLGAYLSSPLHILSHDGFQVSNPVAVDGSTLLTMDFSGFKAGMTLVFSVDVDQVIYIDPDTHDIEVDAVDEGAEFARSSMVTTFTAQHFEDVRLSNQYTDVYDAKIAQAIQQAGVSIALPNDSYNNPQAASSINAADTGLDRSNDTYSTTKDYKVLSTGAIALIGQKPLPITLSGDVYEDHNLNNHQDNGDQGVGSVSLQLWQFDGTNYVNTNKTTTTDANGDYHFTGLLPGTYEVRKTNPPLYFSVGATAGKVGGTTDGTVLSPDVIAEITLLGGDDSVHNDFALARPAALSGFVYHDRDNDGHRDPGEEGIGGVTVTLVPTSVLGTPPPPVSITTNPDGSYSFTGLSPGTWKVLETQPGGWLNGLVTAGTAGGTAFNPGDRIENINLGDGQTGSEYDFGELLPNSIAGRVVVTTYEDCMDDPNPTPLSGVTIELLNAAGAVVATTTTNAQGQYQFNNLPAGNYSVRELQPAGYLEGDSDVGSASGISVTPDLISSIILVSSVHAIDYNFCEHPYSSITGVVQIDIDGNCDTNPNEPKLQGVTIQLLDGNSTVIATAVTDVNGRYTFTHLTPGAYTVRELQPAGYYFEDAHPGSVGGTAVDMHIITDISLPLATDAINYNFCVLPPGSLEGVVMIDVDGNCDTNPNEPKLANVTIQLKDAGGNVIATTKTDANGHYIFDGLAPGTYTVHEIEPVGYFSEDAHVGSVGGTSVGTDTVSTIVLGAGIHGIQYNFCVIVPSSLSGYSYYDGNDDGVFDAGDSGIGGVTLELMDANCMPTGITVVTDSTGFYHFNNLRPGMYGVSEMRPAGYLPGAVNVGSTGGTIGGTQAMPMICDISLDRGEDAVHYDFGQLLPASISGRVQISPTGDCEDDVMYPGLPGVTINVIDSNGHIVATTKTDADGDYSFTGLLPGTYTIQKIQPPNYFLGDSDVGSEGGTSVDPNTISSITLGSDVDGTDYDFCIMPPAAIAGTVFQDGPPIATALNQPIDVPSLRDGLLTPDDTRLPGIVLELHDAVTGQAIFGSQALPGYYAANAPIRVVTDANGNYLFAGLAPGNYAVFEVRPSGYIDGITRPGTTGGAVIGPYTATDPSVTQDFLVPLPGDAIVGITIVAGQTSEQNNFSVVTVSPPEFMLNPTLAFSTPPVVLSPTAIVIFPQAPIVQPLTLAPPLGYSGSSSVLNYTWHLSVIDAGSPRGPGATAPLVRLTAAQAEDLAWQAGMEESEWSLAKKPAKGRTDVSRRMLFGMKGGTPVTGDFNGDGVSDLGVFKDGQWFIDVNGNGVWDEGDLWAKLGYRDDRPVVGDWDGDGKDDIGIFGRAWAGDPRHIAQEPGLPDGYNPHTGVQKNVPPPEHYATLGKRALKLTSQGETRADLIDHVFHYGTPRDMPLVGDWNGDGTDTIAVFQGGTWYLDVDGDGKHTKADSVRKFGRTGDVPVVGDFNGDGVDELAVFRNGTWYIDSNGNGKIDAQDMVFELGQEGDVPVVGDWDGDGRAEPGIYRDGEVANSTARR